MKETNNELNHYTIVRKSKYFEGVFNDATDHSYSPVIVELTDKQLRNKGIMKRVKYLLRILNYVLLLGVGLIFVYPFMWMVVMSLRTQEAALSFSPSLIIDGNIQWVNYLDAWERARFSQYIGNSVFYAVLVLGLQYIFIVPAAFAFARLKFKGNKFLFAVKQLGMMLPAEATLIPVYFIYAKVGLIDTWTGLVLPSLFSMFGIYMFMNQFRTISNEIVESAVMDKAKNRTLMIKIMVPLILPTFITHFLLTFISNWNSYYWVMIMTNKESMKTLPVAVSGLLKNVDRVLPWHTVMAGNIMQLAPILVLYIFGNSQMKRAMIGGRKIRFGGETDKKGIFKRSFSKIKNRLTKTETESTYKSSGYDF